MQSFLCYPAQRGEGCSISQIRDDFLDVLDPTIIGFQPISHFSSILTCRLVSKALTIVISF